VIRALLAGAFVLVAVAVLGFFWIGGTAGLVDAALPPFPEFPRPVERLEAGDDGIVYFATATPYDLDVLLRDPGRAIPTTGRGTLFLPEGATPERPVPAVVLLHGSGGIVPGREMEHAARLRDAGYAAFVVDYYAPRGIARRHDYMLKVIAVTEFDAIADAYAALRLLSTHPAIDGGRVALAGFSYGGMATRFAMDERLREALAPDHPGFAAFVDAYGPCFQVLGTQATNGAPLLTLRGSEDASNELPVCARREQELRDLGVEVEAHVYEGAGHAWENEAPRALREDAPYVAGCEMVYDAKGRSSVDGTPVVDVPVDTPRSERVALRLGSSAALRDCVKSGYVVGSDPETASRANAHLLGFLARALGPGARAGGSLSPASD